MPDLDIRVEPLVAARSPQLQISVLWRDVPQRDSPFHCGPLIEQFVKLAQYGGFAGTAAAPAEAVAVVEEHQSGSRDAAWLLELSGATRGTTTVLRNLLVFSHRWVAPLDRARIRTSIADDDRVPQQLTGRVHALPFACDIAASSDEAQICVELSTTPTSAQATTIESVLMAWQYVTAAGGYERDIWAVRGPLVIPDSEPEWLRNELWLRLDSIGCDDAAFDSLVNAMAGIHSRVARVARLQVD